MKVKLNKFYKVKRDIKHQGIGGKKIFIERILTPDEVDEKAQQGNVVCLMFCIRREDFLPEFNQNLYYGHIENLGYVVAEDELKRCLL